MSAVQNVFIVIFGFTLLAGWLLLVISAFRESLVWGLLVMFVPGAPLAFVVRSWERARTAVIVFMVGAVGLFATMLPWKLPPRAEAATPKDGASAEGATTAAVPKCPRQDRAGNGFSRWCCGASGWTEVSSGNDCSAVYKPTETCDETTWGTTSTTACSTSGPPRKKSERW